MSIAQNAIDEIYIIYEKTQEEHKKLVQELSRIDHETSNILHFLELEDFTNEVGYSAALKLKELRLTRRKIKDEIEPLQVLTTMLDSQKLDKIRQRINANIDKKNERRYARRVMLSRIAKVLNI